MTSTALHAATGNLSIASGAAPVAAGDLLAAPDVVIARGRKEIVFIESDVPDIATLVQGIGTGKEIIILDATADGLRQIADALAGRNGVDALHIITHGAAGSASFGALVLGTHNLSAHNPVLQAIGNSMSVGGDILLYGCDIGSDAGFLAQLAIATGADVAASSDPTGHAALGGDWQLEVSSGSVEAAAVVDAATAALYQGVLAIPTVNVSFDNFSHFANDGDPIDPAVDVVYRVGGNAAYELIIDGAIASTAAYAGYSGVFTGPNALENSVTLKFAAGQVFTPGAIEISNWATSFQDQNLVIKGFNAANQQVGATVTHFLADNLDGNYEAETIALPGMTAITRLVITATTLGGQIEYLMIEGISMTNIQPPAPTVGAVTSTTANGSYKAGDVISVTVLFSAAVDVATAGGLPTLQLESGSTDRLAVYSGGSGSSALSFSYTVQAGDSSADLDYLGTGALALNGASIKATASGVDAALALPAPGAAGSLGANKAIVVDGIAPTLAITSDKTALKLGETANITFTFSENPGASFTLADVTVSGGTLGALGGSGVTRTATFTPTAGTNGGSASVGVASMAYTDTAGNGGGAASAPAISFDTLAPTLAITSSQSALKIGDTATITFTFSEDPGASFVLADVVASGGALGALSGTGLVRTATFTPAPGTNNGVASITVASGAYLDAAANAGGAGATPVLTFDTLAPGAPAVPDLLGGSDSGSSATDNLTNTTAAVFGGAAGSAEAGATVKLYHGATEIGSTVALGDGSWTVNAGLLPEGTHLINARALDAAGNVGADSASLSVTIDRTAPAAPAAPDLAPGSDSGSADSDELTSDDTPTFSGAAGSAASLATVTLHDTNGDPIATTVAAADGSWSVATSVLAEGAHTITAKATDAAGNTSAASTGLALTIDRSAPTTTVGGAALSSDTGASASDMVTKVAVQTVSGTLAANLAAGERVEVSIDNGANWNAASATTGTTAWSLATTLAGSGTLQVRVLDAAGNAGPVFSRAYVVDTGAPGAPGAPDLAAGSDSGVSNADDITADTTPTFSGTAESDATVTLYDGATVIGSSVAAGGTWSITSAALAQGVHTITATATDLAGNDSAASASLAVTVDTSAPTTAIASLALSSDTGASSTDLVTHTAAQMLSGLLDAPLGAGERVEVSFDNGANWSAAVASLGSAAWSLAATLAAGTHTLQVRVANAVDNTGPVFAQDYTLDTAAPAVSITSSATQLKLGETATITFGFSEDPGASFSWDGSVGDVVVTGGTLGAISGSGLTRSATFTPLDGVNGGIASITVAAGAYADLAGNGGGAGASPAISFDTSAPAAPSAPDLVAGSDSGDSAIDRLTSDTTPTFSGTADSGATVTLYDSDGTTVLGSATASGGAWSITSSALAEGTHTVHAKAADAAGNASTASGSLAVTIDTSAPAVPAAPVLDAAGDSGASGSDRITNITTPAVRGTAAAGTTITLLDTDGVTVLGSSLVDGSGNWEITSIALADGAHALRLHARDAAGNTSGLSDPLDLVIDTGAPAAPGAPDLAPASDTGISNSDDVTGDTTPTFTGSAESGASVTLYDGATAIGTAVAFGGAWSITSSPLAAGAHTITARAVDAAGNAGAASSALALNVLTDTPATANASIEFSSDTGASSADLVTMTAVQMVYGVLTTPLAAGERVEASFDDGATWSSAFATPGSDVWSLATMLTFGTHTLQVRVANAVDNTGPVFTRDYTLDMIAPAVTITSSATQLRLGETATITFSFSEDPGASFTWDGSAGDVAVTGGTLGPISGTGLVRTALFTPATATNGGSASITIAPGAFADLAGNPGTAGAAPALLFDTLAPGTPSTPVLVAASDTGMSSSDGITMDAAPTFTGTAEDGATVILYDGNGGALGSAGATGGAWSITTISLPDGAYPITAGARDAAGNHGFISAARTITVDRAAPLLTITSSAALLKVGQSATITFTFSEDPGTGFDAADIAVSGGVLGALTGSGLVRSAVFTPTAGVDGGVATIGVAAGAYADSAGNDGAAGATPAIAFDTLAPAAPTAPALAPASDTGTPGDGVTLSTAPSIEGTAAAHALVTLYDGATLLGSATADALGKWSMVTALAYGGHSLHAIQADAAGNLSPASTAFALQVEAPPPEPDPLVDGVPVQSVPVLLPGGVGGRSVQVPIITSGRIDSSGELGVADIPLFTASGANLLLAQMAPGFGLEASGANVSGATALELLIASIRAATPAHPLLDQQHLTGNGQSFLANLGLGTSLLVQTVAPVSLAAPVGQLTLSSPASTPGQQVALVIDARSLAGGGVIALQEVDFAAIIGSAQVVVRSGSPVVTGDGASQHITMHAGGTGAVLAGGGDDILGFGFKPGTSAAQQRASMAPGSSITTLHGGQGSDVAVFTGARADYDVELHNGYVLVTGKANPVATALVVNVEQLRFSDTSSVVESGADLTTLAGLYQNVLGRQADLGGFAFWAGAHDAGMSLGAIALHMVGSNERSALGSFDGHAAHDLALLYEALFERAADAAGLAYWEDAMQRGATLEQVATGMIESVEMVGNRRAVHDWDFSL